jgi:6-phosphogluconolactonase
VNAVVDVHPDAASLIRAAADRIRRTAAESIAARGRFAIALSGGSTPRRLFELLAGPPGAAGPERPASERAWWQHTEFFWGDERSVPPDHPDSNFRMAREAMLAPLDVPDARIHRMRGEASDLDAAARDYEREITSVLGLAAGKWPRFDLVLLGMGPDGHTASLFPGTAALDERSRVVVANHVPALDTWRLTLTAPAINHAREVVFLIEGAGKADRLKEVLEGPREPHRLPSQLIAPDEGTLTWMVDAAAAARLTAVT